MAAVAVAATHILLFRTCHWHSGAREVGAIVRMQRNNLNILHCRSTNNSHRNNNRTINLHLLSHTTLAIYPTLSVVLRVSTRSTPPVGSSSRWIMIGYMSLLNLMSDWKCYSIAPIARMTIDKFGGNVDPEGLVTVFLLANTVASALEPAILGRFGLRRTILFGACMLYHGNRSGAE